MDDKFEKYLLSMDHEEGRTKASYFRTVGFNESNWEDLREQILNQLPKVQGRYNRENKAGGQNWEAAMQVTGPTGTATILTTWAVTPNAPTAMIGAPASLHVPVELKTPVEGFPVGTRGVIIDAYPNLDVYTVEVVDKEGRLVALLPCRAAELRPAE